MTFYQRAGFPFPGKYESQTSSWLGSWLCVYISISVTGHLSGLNFNRLHVHCLNLCEFLCVLVLSESSITPGSAHLSASLSTEERGLIKIFHFGMSVSESLSALCFNYESLCPLTVTAGRNFSEEGWTIHQYGWQPSVDLTIDFFPSSIICIATSGTMKVNP